MTIHTPIRSHEELLWFGNTLIGIKVASSAGADGICVIEHHMPFGEAPPLHVHHREDEIFHLLQGEMRFQIGDQQVLVGKGETVLAPKGVPHSFRVESVLGAHCLTITRGPDFETMVRQTSRPVFYPGLPEAEMLSPEKIQQLTRACAAHAIEILGPPIA